ncbi:MAG: hypothetical protein KFW21_02090 [Spirochaetota bacterium]|nr:hypothetical protein [Spirochaetota bacterium]
MRRIIYMIIVLGFVQIIWGTPPKILQPQEHSIIKKDSLFVFIEPNPEDIEAGRYINIEIFERSEGKNMITLLLSPDQNYKDSIDISSWANGKYLLKVIYVNKKGKHLTKSSWRNFSIMHE